MSPSVTTSVRSHGSRVSYTPAEDGNVVLVLGGEYINDLAGHLCGHC